MGEILVGQSLGNPARDVLANTGNPIQRGNFGGHKGPYLETRVANLLQTFHTAVWPGDGQWVKFWSVKVWAIQLEMSLQTQETPSKGAILGVTKAHISRLEWPTCFKLFTQLYDQGTDSG